MGPERPCPRCGNAIPSDAPGGVCPVCLIEKVARPASDTTIALAARDECLLFGLIAAKLGCVSPSRFRKVFDDWASFPKGMLEDDLVEGNAISTENAKLVRGVLGEIVEHYDGDPTRALGSLGGRGALDAILRPAGQAADSREMDTGFQTPIRDEASILGTSIHLEEQPGRYTRSSEYSRGGMGRILLVHDELLIRDVALKELLPDRGATTISRDDPSPVNLIGKMMARFVREARVTGKLEHPTIVPVYELGRRANGTIYYTMRMVRGQTLGAALKNCARLEDRLALLPNFVDLCMGIAYAHSRGVIHRDIKPSNVMVGEFGETVVIDWGLAKVVGDPDDTEEAIQKSLADFRRIADTSSDATQAGEVMGTPCYMSPEQAAGTISRVDARSDIFSLGSVLYEILTSSVPFDGESVSKILHGVLHDSAPAIDATESHVPRELISICQKAMAKDKKERYQSCKEFARDVQQFLSGSLVSAYHYTAAERCKMFYRRNRLIVNTIGGSCGIIVAVVFMSFIGITNARDDALLAKDQETIAKERAESETYLAQVRLVNNHIERGSSKLADDLLWDIQPRSRGWEWGHLLNRAHPSVLTIGDASYGRFSPRGDLVAVASRNRDTRILSLPDGEERMTFEGTRGRILSIAFSGDGETMVAGTRDLSVRFWSVRSGRMLADLRGHTGGVHTVAFTPSGERVLSASFDNSIRVWDVATLTGQGRLFAQEMHLSGLSGFQVSPSRPHLVAWFLDDPKAAPSVQCWDYEQQRMLWAREGIRPVYSSDGQLVLFGEQNHVVLVDAFSKQEVDRLSDHEAFVKRIRVTSDGNYAISGAGDGSVRVWDLRAKRLLSAAAHSGAVHDITILPDDSAFAISSLDGKVSVWKIPTGDLIGRYVSHDDVLLGVVPSPDNRHILTASLDQTVRLWDVFSRQGYRQMGEPSLFKTFLHTASEGNVASFSSSVNTVSIMNLQNGQMLGEYATSTRNYRAQGLVSRDGRTLAMVLDGYTMFLWDRDTDTLIDSVSLDRGPIKAIAFTPEGTMAAIASWDGKIAIWRMDGNLEVAWDDPDRVVTAMEFTEDGESLVYGSSEGVLARLDLMNGSVLWERNVHRGAVQAVSIDAPGILVGSASADRSAALTRLDTGEEHAALLGHARSVTDIAFSPRESRAATSSVDGAIRLWHTGTGKEVLRFQAGERDVYGIEFVDEGRAILAGGAFPTLRKFEAAPWDSLGDLAAERGRFSQYRATRNLQSASAQEINPPLKRWVFLSPETLQQHLDDLISDVELQTGMVQDERGLVLADLSAVYPFAGLQLQESDLLLSMNGLPITDLDSMVAALQAVRTSFQGGTIPQIAIEIERNDTVETLQYRPIPKQRSSHNLQLSRGRAIELFEKLLGLGRRNAVSLTRYSRATAKRLGLKPSEPGGIQGLWLPEISADVSRDEYLSLGLSIDDRLVLFDGQTVTSIAQLLDAIEGAVSQLRDGSRDALELRVERGEFHDVTVSISVEGRV